MMIEPAPEHLALNRLRAQLGDSVLETHAHRGDVTVVIHPDRYHEAMRLLHDDPECEFDFMTDITCVDRLKLKLQPRFEVVVHLYSRRHNLRIRVKTRPLSDSDPQIDSIVDIHPGANWPEREVYDMFGIRFAGHPDLRRILMYEEFVGHPLRKDYPVNKRQPRIPMRDIPDDRPGMMFV